MGFIMTQYEKDLKKKYDKELQDWKDKREKDRLEAQVLLEKYQKELDAKFDPFDLKIKESILFVRDYTGFYFYPAVLLGIYLGWKIVITYCDTLMKAYYP